MGPSECNKTVKVAGLADSTFITDRESSARRETNSRTNLFKPNSDRMMLRVASPRTISDGSGVGQSGDLHWSCYIQMDPIETYPERSILHSRWKSEAVGSTPRIEELQGVVQLDLRS